MNKFFDLFLLFYIYSIIGWVLETIFVSIKQKKIANRGFLIGPYCPIYGISSVLMIIFLSKYKEDLFILFIVGIFITSILEYFTSFVLEKLFKIRWWDYSDKLFNIDGRVCLSNSFIFGLLCIFLIRCLNPIVISLINLIPYNMVNTLTLILLILFLLDCIFSYKTIFIVKNTINNINVRKDSTEEIGDKVRKKLNEQSKRIGRLINAFPNFIIKITFK